MRLDRYEIYPAVPRRHAKNSGDLNSLTLVKAIHQSSSPKVNPKVLGAPAMIKGPSFDSPRKVA